MWIKEHEQFPNLPPSKTIQHIDLSGSRLVLLQPYILSSGA